MQQIFKRGDIVSFQGVVRFDFNPAEVDEATVSGSRRLHVNVDYHDITVPVETVKMVTPFFKEGDTAYIPDLGAGPTEVKNPPTKVEVLSVWEGLVWVKMEDGKTNVIQAVDLKRAHEVEERSS